MQAVRSALLAAVAVLVTTATSMAQTTSDSAPAGGGGGLFPVWAVILIFGIIIFVIATSLSVRSIK